MARVMDELQVMLAANGFYPRAFRWQGQTLRILAVEALSTHGAERRFRVRTPIGGFELGLFADAGLWRVRRAPNWFDRAWARVRRLPRCPLPPWRRRAGGMTPAEPAAGTQPARSEDYASRLALVR